ncbi:MAG: hypothetical protein LBE12_19615 [Planctomycetaceae bacterium]|nr:hypothetical protein [Planctomycetaceae bacterium]
MADIRENSWTKEFLEIPNLNILVFMRTTHDIRNDMDFHLLQLRVLFAEMASLQTTPNNCPDVTGNDSQPKTVHKRRSRLELKFLIESVVDTFGTEISIKELAKKAGIAESLLYREPYSTYSRKCS